METPDPAVTITEWPGMPCDNCGRAADTHMEDGKCLFEPTVFKPLSLGASLISTWIYQTTEDEKPKRPYPEPSKFDRRKERALAMKSRNKGRR
jgi:hypothetical protein